MPLDVVVDGARHVEGVDLSPDELVGALTRGARVTTSQPPPAAFADAFARAVEAGATAIVSVHLSGELSGTVQAARLAAATAPVPVHVVDSRVVGMALGFVVLDAARFAAGGEDTHDPLTAPGGAEDGPRADTSGPGADPDEVPLPGPRGWAARLTTAVRRYGRGRHRPGPGPGAAPVPDGAAVAARAAQVASSARVWFLVESLDHLRRGGRLSAPAAAIGTVLGLRPLLALRDGAVVVVEKVRTRRAARDRLEALAVAEAAARPAVRVAVHHLGQPDLGAEVAAQVAAWAGDRVVETVVCESSAVLAAHAGPGLLAVVVVDVSGTAVAPTSTATTTA